MSYSDLIPLLVPPAIYDGLALYIYSLITKKRRKKMQKYRNGAVDIHGNIRTNGHEENARKAIQKAIKTAINNIKIKNQELASHLDENIKTGQYCRYVSSIKWE